MYEVVNKLGISVKNIGNADNVIKFVPSICLVNDTDLEIKIKILQFHKIPLTKLSHIKILGLSKDELQRRITVSKSNNFFIKVINNPLILLDYDKYTLKKRNIQIERKAKIVPLFVEKPKQTAVIKPENIKPAEIKSVSEFPKEIAVEPVRLVQNKIEEDIFSIIEQSLEEKPNGEIVTQVVEEKVYDNRCSSSVEKILRSNTNRLLNDNSFMKFEELSKIVNCILQTLDYNLLSKNGNIDDNIKNLLLANADNDVEILLTALSFDANLTNLEYAKLKSVVHLILAEEKQLARVA